MAIWRFEVIACQIWQQEGKVPLDSEYGGVVIIQQADAPAPAGLRKGDDLH